MKTKSFLAACLMTFALVMQGAGALFQPARAQALKTDDAAPRARGSVVPMGAIVELERDAVVAHEISKEGGRQTGISLQSVGGKSPRIDFESPEVQSYEAELRAEHEYFKARAALISPGLKVRTEVSRLINAVSVQASSPEELSAIAAMPGVKRVEAIKEYNTTLDASVPLIAAPAAWERLGGPSAAGAGVKIAIIDTGIDITNPLFSGAGFTAPPGFPRGNPAFTNNKVIVAKAFLTDILATPKDERGHGSNVAGIAAGNLNTSSPVGVLSGVAPQAYLGNYRVFGPNGSASGDLVIRALEEAVTDGFDVVNMSLGSESDGSLDLGAKAVEAAVAKGVVVAISAGNSGEDGEMTISTPGIAPSAITVAAASNSHIIGPIVSVTGPVPFSQNLINISSIKGGNAAAAAVFNDSFTSLPYVEVTQARACNGLAAGSLAGKVALIERGNCSFADKVNAAASAGAKAAIIYNNDLSENPTGGGDNLISMDVAGTTIPSVFVSRTNGLALRDFVRTNASATITIKPLGGGTVAADVIAEFSSRGPAATGTLKPDVAAPGVAIYSGAVKLTGANVEISDPSGFQSSSGTSMASPHVAGAAALLIQLHPTWTPEQVKSALISSATTDVFTALDQKARVGVLTSGGGRINVASAGAVNATFSPASLSFGINKLKKKTVSLDIDFKITNVGSGQNTFNLSVQALDPGDGASLSLSSTSVPLASGQTGSVKINFTALKSAAKRDYTGYVVVTDSAGQTMRVPFWARFKKKV